MDKCIIAAVADDMAIGQNGTMPWHLSEDLKYFKRTTMSYPVIMGRATFQSLGKPLPGRKNIVISTTLPKVEGIEVVSSLEEAFHMLTDEPRVFIIGGASVYRQAIQEADTLYITHLHTTVKDADTFFPAIDSSVWRINSKSESFTDTESGIKFEFVTYSKKRLSEKGDRQQHI